MDDTRISIAAVLSHAPKKAVHDDLQCESDKMRENRQRSTAAAVCTDERIGRNTVSMITVRNRSGRQKARA